MPIIPDIVEAKGARTLMGKRVYLNKICQDAGGAGVVLVLIGIKNNPKNNPKGSMIAPMRAALEIR